MWNAPGPSAAKTITSAAEARRVALLCGHHLDRLRVLAMASVVRLNGGARNGLKLRSARRKTKHLFLQLPAQKAENSAQLVPLLQNLVTSR